MSKRTRDDEKHTRDEEKRPRDDDEAFVAWKAAREKVTYFRTWGDVKEADRVGKEQYVLPEELIELYESETESLDKLFNELLAEVSEKMPLVKSGDVIRVARFVEDDPFSRIYEAYVPFSNLNLSLYRDATNVRAYLEGEFGVLRKYYRADMVAPNMPPPETTPFLLVHESLCVIKHIEVLITGHRFGVNLTRHLQRRMCAATVEMPLLVAQYCHQPFLERIVAKQHGWHMLETPVVPDSAGNPFVHPGLADVRSFSFPLPPPNLMSSAGERACPWMSATFQRFAWAGSPGRLARTSWVVATRISIG